MTDSWHTADLAGPTAYPGETPQQQEQWDVPQFPMLPEDPSYWYRLNGENAEISPLPIPKGKPIYVHQGSAYVDQEHPGLVEWAGDSGLKLAVMEPPQVMEHPMGAFGFDGRRPVIYDPTYNMLHVGPDGSCHSDVQMQISPEMKANRQAEYSYGWIGHNPEAEPNDPVFNRGFPHEVGWYSYGKIPYAAHQTAMQLATQSKRYQRWQQGRTAEYPGGSNMLDQMLHQEDMELFNNGDPKWEPPKDDLDFEPKGPFACSQCDYKPSSLADYRMHVEHTHTPHEEEIQDGHFPQIDDFDEPLPLRRTQPKPNGGNTVASLTVIKLSDSKPCERIPQFLLYSKLAGFESPTTRYYGAFDDGEIVGYGVVREGWGEPEVMMIQASEHGRGVGTAVLRRIQRDYDRFYSHADTKAGERLMTRCGMVNVKGHLWRWAAGKAPKDMLEAQVPFVYDIPKDQLVLGYPGYDTHDVTSPAGFSPGGIVEGTYEPGGQVTIWTASTWPFSVRHLMDLWKAQAPQMEVTGVQQKELDGSMSKLAGLETLNVGPYMNALVQSSPAASNAYKALAAKGGEVWVVGGAVRDYMQGKAPKDTDLMVRGIPPEEVEHTLKQLPGGVKLTGKNFGVYRYWSGHQGQDEVEIALPREDTYSESSRGKGKITVNPDLPIEKDLERRDFTANSMAVRLHDGALADPFGGAQDLQRGVLRTTHPNSFKEDPTRLVRALTAHGRFGLVPDERTRHEMEANAHLIRHESPDALNKVVDKLFESSNPAQAVRLGHDTGILKYLFPDVDKNWDYDQRNPHHNLPLGEHLVHALDNVSRLSTDPDLRMATLQHDVGKPASAWTDENGHNHYYKTQTGEGEHRESLGEYHESLGAKMVAAHLRSLNFPVARINRQSELVRRHMFPPFNDEVGARKFLNKHGEYADDLLHLREADQYGKGQTQSEIDARTSANQMRGLVEQQREMQAPVSQAAMAINGNDILSMGLKPGPAVGQVLQFLTNAVLENPELNTREQLLDLAQQQITALPLEARATNTAPPA